MFSANSACKISESSSAGRWCAAHSTCPDNCIYAARKMQDNDFPANVTFAGGRGCPGDGMVALAGLAPGRGREGI